MKRRIAMLLAVLMTVSCLTTALAAGEEAAAEQSLYGQYGPWGQWTEAQQTAAEDWTDDDWTTYWDDYYREANKPMNQYWVDNDTWSEMNYGNGGTSWDDYLTQIKQSMGVPFPAGINVSVNGTYLKLAGVEPIAVAGRTMVPFRAFFEELNGTVRYQDGTTTAVLQDGTTVRMTQDSAQLEVVKDGKSTKIDMGETPYVKDGRTYLPVRAAAEALGYDLYWDDTYKFVHLTDWDALQENLDGQLTSMNAIIAASQKTVDPEKTYSTTENLTVSGTLYGETEHDTASVSLDFSALSKGHNISVDGKMDIDLGGLRETVFSVLGDDGLALIDSLSGGRVSGILNGDDGLLYVKGDKLSLLPVAGGKLPDNVWIGTQMDPEFIDTALDVQKNMTMGQILVEQGRYGWYYRQSPWESVMSSAQFVLLGFSDKNFTKQGSDDNCTYTLKLDMVTLAKRADEMGLFDGMSVTDLITGQENMPTVDMKMTAGVTGGKLASFSFDGSMKMSGVMPLEMTFKVAGTPTKMDGSFAFKGRYVGKIEMTAGATTVETSKTVPSAPPAGEKVRDLNVVLGYQTPGVSESYGMANYVSDLLDLELKGTYDPALLSAMGYSQEEAKALHDRSVSSEVSRLSYAFAIGDYSDLDNHKALMDDLRSIYQQCAAKAQYKVGEIKKTETGYTVAVEVTPLNVFVLANEEMTSVMNKSSDVEIFSKAWSERTLGMMREKLMVAGYLEPITYELQITRNLDGTLSAGQRDLTTLGQLALPAYPGELEYAGVNCSVME